MSLKDWISVKTKRLIHYEYWPFYIFYFPMYFYGLYLAMKARSFTYFSTVNPCMKHGGVMGVSKYQVLNLIPKEYIPESILVEEGAPVDNTPDLLERNDMRFPLILKPDVGERGKLVEVVKSIDDLLEYLRKIHRDVIIQEFVDFPFEAGVFYFKYPDEKRGTISSIVTKEFLHVTGDGKSSLSDLISQNTRAFHRRSYLFDKFSSCLAKIPSKGEKVYLEPIGNHNRGTTFLNGNHYVNDELLRVFDSISEEIPGFFYGRFDVKARSEKDFIAGRNIKILELNGVSSEPAHIYDPEYRLIQAYRDIAKHMRIVFEIAKMNYKKGIKRSSLKHFLKDLLLHFRTNE